MTTYNLYVNNNGEIAHTMAGYYLSSPSYAGWSPADEGVVYWRFEWDSANPTFETAWDLLKGEYSQPPSTKALQVAEEYFRNLQAVYNGECSSLAHFSGDGEVDVRVMLGEDPSTPAEVLTRLAEDENRVVRETAKRYPVMEPDFEPKIRYRVAHNLPLPLRVIEKIM